MVFRKSLSKIQIMTILQIIINKLHIICFSYEKPPHHDFGFIANGNLVRYRNSKQNQNKLYSVQTFLPSVHKL